MTRSDYRHPKHDAMAEMVRGGMSNNAVAKQLHVDHRAVARVRAHILGPLEPHRNATSRESKVDACLVAYDNGHTGWTGRLSVNGIPTIRHLGFEMSASHVVFERWYGRDPVGIVKAACAHLSCLSPQHLGDELTRRIERMLERAVRGLPMKPWDVCPKDLHDWDRSGRLTPDLIGYCKSCNTDRAARRRRDIRDTKRKEES